VGNLRQSLTKAAIGVWDTVGSLGVPIGFLKEITNEYLQFHDTRLSKDALHAYHAVSIDEQRETFKPSLWAMRAGAASVTDINTPSVHVYVLQKLK